MGELHLEIVVERLRREHRAEVRVGEPRVAYRETVRGAGEATYRHVRQEGGTGRFAHVALSVEPGARGSGLVFTDDTVGGVIAQGFVPSIEKGVRGAMARGVASGHPMVDVRVRLLDGSLRRRRPRVGAIPPRDRARPHRAATCGSSTRRCPWRGSSGT
jgi:elongation factor G